MLKESDNNLYKLLYKINSEGDASNATYGVDKGYEIKRNVPKEYTLTEKRPADGYAVADDIVFRLERKTDADGHQLDEADVYYLKDKKKLWIIPWEEWELLDDATVIMKDDITRIQISKVDIATGKELPGAELVIKDKDGNTVAQWVSEDKAHYIEKLPAGEYTLTEITAPNGYQLAESIAFTVLTTGELQTVVVKDARIPEETPHEDSPSNTPQPTPGSTPAPSPAPVSAPTATPAPTAGALAASAWVRVGPPLSARGCRSPAV